MKVKLSLLRIPTRKMTGSKKLCFEKCWNTIQLPSQGG